MLQFSQCYLHSQSMQDIRPFFIWTGINFNGIKKKWANKLVLARKAGKTCPRYENFKSTLCDPAPVPPQPSLAPSIDCFYPPLILSVHAGSMLWQWFQTSIAPAFVSVRFVKLISLLCFSAHWSHWILKGSGLMCWIDGCWAIQVWLRLLPNNTACFLHTLHTTQNVAFALEMLIL